MKAAIDKPGCNIASIEIDLGHPTVMANTSDAILIQCHISGINGSGKDIDELAVFEDDIGLFFPAGNSDEFLQFAQSERSVAKARSPGQACYTFIMVRKLVITLAAALVVGLGHIINGHTTKGLALLLVFYLAIPFTLYTSLLLTSGVFGLALTGGVLCSVGLWIYSVYDTWRFLNPKAPKVRK